MNIFGVGGPELVLILLIMLIIAGPKRMLQWAYILGTYVAKLRRLWTETMRALQQELDASGVEIQLPKEPPTRQSIRRATAKVLQPIVKPVEDSLREFDAEMQSRNPEQPIASSQGNLGTWSRHSAEDDADNSTYGTWSGKTKE